MKTPLFNLVDEEWIPVLDMAGSQRLVGLREALVAAHQLRGLAAASPLAEVAITRLLLAVLHRALQGPRSVHDAVELWEEGRFPEEQVESYLDRWIHRFYLFHDEEPFYQVADLPKESCAPWTRLLPDLSSGDNATLFDHTMDDEPPPASPPEAAVAILVHQSFVPGGLIRRLGAASGKAGPLAAAATFLPQGQTLFQTLVLNLVDYEPEGDEPIWERPPYRAADLWGGKAQGLLAGTTRRYTWLSRAVCLIPDGDGMVRFMAYGPGVTPLEGPERDPMCAYRNTNKGLEVYRLREGRAFWRDFEALGPQQSAGISPAVVEHATNVLGDVERPAMLFPLVVVGQMLHPGKHAKVLDVRWEVYPVSPRIADPAVLARVGDAVNRAEKVATSLQKAARRLASCLGVRQDRASGRRTLNDFLRSLPHEAHYWSSLQSEFPSFLERMATEGAEAAVQIWLSTVNAVVWRAWELTASAIGLGPAHLRAIAEAERVLQEELALAR